MYHLILYGLMASPPTKAHQAIVKQLLLELPPQMYTINYSHDGETVFCTVRDDAGEPCFHDTLASLGLLVLASDAQIKRALAMRGVIDYTEIVCMPSADGPPVLGKSPSAQNHHRFEMLKLAMAELDDPRVIVSDLEIKLSQLLALPSYTANTLVVLREGLCRLMEKPDHLLSVDEKKKPIADQQLLLDERKANMMRCLEQPTHDWLTAHGLMADAAQTDALDITLVMGLDSFNTLERWFNSETILNHATRFRVIEREGSSRAMLDPYDSDIHRSPFYEAIHRLGKVSRCTFGSAEGLSTYSSTACRDQLVLREIKAGQLAGLHHQQEDVLLQMLPSSVLAYIQSQRLYQSIVSVIADPEGNGVYYNKTKLMNARLTDTLKLGHNLSKLTVSIGDLSDKGPDDLAILMDIKQRVLDQKEKWVLIAGNRDDNKIRMLELIDPVYIKTFLTQPSPYWDKEGMTPRDYVSSLGLDEGAYRALDVQSQRVMVLKWMLEKTMTAPRAFEYRREALQQLGYLSPIDDIMVMKSFLEEILTAPELDALARVEGFEDRAYVLPEAYRGIKRWYIEQSQSMAVIGHTLYSHAGLPEGVFPYLQSGEHLAIEATPANFIAWIMARNAERKENIEAYIDGMLTGRMRFISKPSRPIPCGISIHPAVQCSLGKTVFQEGEDSARAFNLQSFDSFHGVYDTETLRQAEIYTSIHGHQIALTGMPRIIKTEYVVIVNADTRLGDSAETQCSNGTVVELNRAYCLSEDGRFIADSLDPWIGRTLDIKQDLTGELHHYAVLGCEASTASESLEPAYVLVCYEKKTGSRFYSVDPHYGIVLKSAHELSAMLNVRKRPASQEMFFVDRASDDRAVEDDATLRPLKRV